LLLVKGGILLKYFKKSWYLIKFWSTLMLCAFDFSLLLLFIFFVCYNH
jgi:hypothetical protein